MARDTEKQQAVLDLLRDLKGVEPLKKLFWQELNHERVKEELPMGGWAQPAKDALAEPPLLLAGAGEKEEFHVIYNRLKSDKLLLGDERPVVNRLLRDHPYSLFVFSNASQDRWHFLNVKYDSSVERRTEPASLLRDTRDTRAVDFCAWVS